MQAIVSTDKEILNWISPLDFWITHHDVSRQRHTGKFRLDDQDSIRPEETFVHWRIEPSMLFVWIIQIEARVVNFKPT